MAKLNTDSRTLLLAALSVGGGLAAYAAVRKWNESDLSGRVVLITGATRGLGLALARECAAQGARLALTARDQDELDKVRREFVQDNHAVLTLPCDVTDQGQVIRLIDRVTDHYGQIDVLVNNAGTIQVAPVANMALADFERAMATNFYGVLHTVLAVMPQMRNRRQGHIVNVTSIGGKVAMPHLLPYSCSKFAATALSEGLHAELAGDGVHVLTVVPGLLRTGSYVNAEYKGNVEDEARWFSFGEMGPGSMDPARAARQIVKALRQGEAELILSAGAQLLARVSGSAPSLTQRLLALVDEYGLPAPGPHQDVMTGREVRRQSETLQTLSNATRSTAELYNQPQS